jgi:aerotaxis receptor
MEELSSTVKQTASTADQVARQSNSSTQVATEGGSAVHKVGQAMQAIDASSSKVRDIIGVIEGIAFQTNILALNAAVEAARAGEQGRGFAVVASEVRALAQRSAVAAKEIRELIATSAQQISEGSVQMTSAGKTIDAVVQSVKEVGELIQRITHATQEQAIGIAQVNEAVTQLDTVTQQNAALVEQSAASADGLNQSALILGRSVEVFKMP